MWLRRTGGCTCACRVGSIYIGYFVRVSVVCCLLSVVCHKMTVGPSKIGLRERLRVCRGGSRNQLRGLKEGGSARHGAVPCLSADLTTHAVYNFSPCTRGSTHERVLRHQGRPSASSQRQRTSSRWQQQRHKSGQQRQYRRFVAARTMSSGAVATTMQVAMKELAATAASRLRAPMFHALLAFHVQYRRFVAARSMRNGAVAS